MAKDIMSRRDKQSVSSGFINRPGSWDNTVGPAVDAIGGAVGDAAMGGIGLIIDHIAQPLSDLVQRLISGGGDTGPDTIKQAVSDLFAKDEELKKKLGGALGDGTDKAYAGETILGGRDAYGNTSARR